MVQRAESHCKQRLLRRAGLNRHRMGQMDWHEVEQLAGRPEYSVFPAVRELAADVARELGTKSPYDSQRTAH